MGSASLVTFSLAFIIFFICSRRCKLGKELRLPTGPQFTSSLSPDAYLDINEVVKGVYVLLHKAFHLNTGEERKGKGWQQSTGDLRHSGHGTKVSQIQVRERIINAFS